LFILDVRRMSPERGVGLGVVGRESEMIEIVIDQESIEEEPILGLTAEIERDTEEAEIAKDLDPLERRDTVTGTEKEEVPETDTMTEIERLKLLQETEVRKKT